MRRFPGRIFRIICGLLTVWASVVVSIAAQEEKVRTISFEGPEVFCHVLHKLDLKPIVELDADKIPPKETVIVVFGQPRVLNDLHERLGGLSGYLERGGSLLIATDFRMQSADLPVRITGEPKLQSSETAYRGSKECPWLTYPIPELADLQLGQALPHPLFRFLQKGIATNCPSQVVIRRENVPLVPVLQFPVDLDRAIRDLGRGGPFVVEIDHYMVASPADALPQRRALYVAGHGMFMNGMMMQADNDNFAFALNAVQWLREAPEGRQRSHALFIVDGKIITEFDTKLTPPLPPIPLPPVTAINRLLRGLEDERVFHQLLAKIAEPDRWLALTLGLLTLGLLVYGSKKLMEGRVQPDAGVPMLAGTQATVGAPSPLIRQRIDALICKNLLGEDARAIVHEWFREQFGIAPGRWSAGFDGNLQVESARSSDRQLLRLVDYVLRLARAPEPTQVTRSEFCWLVESLPLLGQAAQANQIALFVAGKNVRQAS